MVHNFGRIITAMVTPFNNEGGLDIRAVEPLVKHLERTGSETLVLGGTTGEGPTLNSKEKILLFEEVMKHKLAQTKIIVNVGTNHTLETVNNAYDWCSIEGVNGIMVVCPYYNKPNQKGLYEHFKAVNAVSCKSIMAYHIPGRTGVTMSSETMIKVAKLSNVTLLKVILKS